MKPILPRLAAAVLLSSASPAWAQPPAAPASEPAPLVMGHTFTLESAVLGEARVINVYAPAGYAESPEVRLPVLYMPDGGIGEDFLHVAGLVQVSAGNGTMRPMLLVGIQNTQRRRDLTGPTENADDRTIAPLVGGSAAFRRFIRDELMPAIQARYRTTGETAIVGESLAGLFIVETLLREPELFDTYIAFDPSLWWNDERLVDETAAWLRAGLNHPKTLYLASGGESEITRITRRLVSVLQEGAPPALRWHYEPLPNETHATIYHPAALRAFRHLFAPPPAAGSDR